MWNQCMVGRKQASRLVNKGGPAPGGVPLVDSRPDADPPAPAFALLAQLCAATATVERARANFTATLRAVGSLLAWLRWLLIRPL